MNITCRVRDKGMNLNLFPWPLYSLSLKYSFSKESYKHLFSTIMKTKLEIIKGRHIAINLLNFSTILKMNNDMNGLIDIEIFNIVNIKKSNRLT